MSSGLTITEPFERCRQMDSTKKMYLIIYMSRNVSYVEGESILVKTGRLLALSVVHCVGRRSQNQ